MLNKKHLHHIWRRLRPINTWIFGVIFIVFAAVSVYALRQNNLEMVRLRQEVIKADESGQNVEGALKNLREYVYSHMNTDLTAGSTAIYPPIQLKHTYERLTEAERQRVSTINNQVYANAQRECEAHFGQGQLGERVACVEQYITAHAVKENPIQDSLYKFDFVNPSWSPDLAGWSIVIAAISGVLFALRYGVERWFKYELD